MVRDYLVSIHWLVYSAGSCATLASEYVAMPRLRARSISDSIGLSQTQQFSIEFYSLGISSLMFACAIPGSLFGDIVIVCR